MIRSNNLDVLWFCVREGFSKGCSSLWNYIVMGEGIRLSIERWIVERGKVGIIKNNVCNEKFRGRKL